MMKSLRKRKRSTRGTGADRARRGISSTSLRRNVVARVTTRARPAPTARSRASRPSHCRRVRLSRRASQTMNGVSAAQRYASNSVRRMGPDAGRDGRSAARQGSVRRLAEMRMARNVPERDDEHDLARAEPATGSGVGAVERGVQRLSSCPDYLETSRRRRRPRHRVLPGQGPEEAGFAVDQASQRRRRPGNGQPRAVRPRNHRPDDPGH